MSGSGRVETLDETDSPDGIINSKLASRRVSNPSAFIMYPSPSERRLKPVHGFHPAPILMDDENLHV